jgi:AcrR family transcriptional regulator
MLFAMKDREQARDLVAAAAELRTSAADAKRRDTAQSLLAAAEQVLIEEGIQALSVRRIGTVSGLAPTLVTYHFGTMASLLAELCRLNLEPMLKAWQPLEQGRFATMRQLLEAWLAPLLFPSAFVPEGRALIVLDEIASHGDTEIREMLLASMMSLSGKLQAALHPFVPHLSPQALRARVRFLSGAALGPPPRNRRLAGERGAPPLDGIDYLLDFAVASLRS